MKRGSKGALTASWTQADAIFSLQHSSKPFQFLLTVTISVGSHSIPPSSPHIAHCALPPARSRPLPQGLGLQAWHQEVCGFGVGTSSWQTGRRTWLWAAGQAWCQRRRWRREMHMSSSGQGHARRNGNYKKQLQNVEPHKNASKNN